jgi:sugar phosphate isomerase/epimerase
MPLTLAPSAAFEITGPDELDRYCDAAASAGFDGLTLGMQQMGHLDPDTVATTIAKHGLYCSDFTAMIITRHDDTVIANAREMAPFIQATGAGSALTLVWTTVTAECHDRIARVSEILGVPCCLEVSPAVINTIDDGLQIVHAIGAEHAVIAVDSYHFYRAGSTLEMLRSLDPEHLGIVQFDDAMPAISNDYAAETMTRRAWPGEGELDLVTFADTIISTGWNGAVSVEVLLGDRARRYDVEEFARLAHDTTAPYWSGLHQTKKI